MSYSLIAHASAQFADPSHAIAVTDPVDMTGADLFVAFTGRFNFGDSPTLTMSDSESNTWTPLTEYAGTYLIGQLYYTLAPVTDVSQTFQFDSATTESKPSLVIAAFSGAAASSVFDQENGSTTDGDTSLAPGSVTPGVSNELIVAALLDADTDPVSIDAGLSIAEQVPCDGGSKFGIALAWLQQGSASAINPTWSWTVNDAAAVAVATFKAAASAGQPMGRRFGGVPYAGAQVGRTRLGRKSGPWGEITRAA